MAILQERIKERRTALGFTLLEIADLLGVKEATVQRYESGEIKNIKHDTIVELSKIFKCTPQYLMGWSDMINEPTSIEDLNIFQQRFQQRTLFKGDNDLLIVHYYHKLNNEGKKKLIEYAQDLTKIKIYIKGDTDGNI